MHNVFESENDFCAWLKECKEAGVTELDLTGILIFSNAYQPVDSGYDHWNYGVTEEKIYLPLLNLPKELFQIATLLKLRLGKRAAKIEVLPSEIGQLTKLISLDLSNNNISSLPVEIGQLTELASLNLSGNQLSNLPSTFQNLKALKILDIRANPLVGVPPEVLERIEQPEVILRSYFARGRKPLNEVKLILVGQGSVGKTSLARRIIFNTYDPQQNKTDGIAISQWHVKNTSASAQQQSTIRVNLWDFGGQEIMHATHQFFLTKRSIYLIALDTRLTSEENRIEYWLKIIQSFSDASPVLVVGNKIDQHQLDIDRFNLQKKYPNIIGFFETSAATGAGIEHLKSAIAEQVNQMPNVRDLVVEDWLRVKTALEERHEQTNFIDQDEYIKLCVENRVLGEGNQFALLSVLHDLGVILHFQDNPRLESLGILNPQWVTNGVYRIVNSKILFNNHGVLTLSMLNDILNLPEYPRNKRLFIIDMMKRFELCFDLGQDKTFMVPDLLPKAAVTNFHGVLAFEYHYPILPSSVMTRFIVRMNQKIDDGLVWRTGVVLKIGENKAQVKADIEDRKITIAIDGLEHTRRDALSAIRFQLDEIHRSIKGLNPEKYVPVPGAVNAKPLKYEYLLKLERDGEDTIKVDDGDGLRKVNIAQMLNGVENEYQRKQYGTVINIGGNVTDSTIIAGDNNEVKK